MPMGMVDDNEMVNSNDEELCGQRGFYIKCCTFHAKWKDIKKIIFVFVEDRKTFVILITILWQH